MTGEKLTTYRGRDGRMARVWTCDTCRKPFEWGPDSWWHGSLKDMDDCRWDRLSIACSQACRDRAGIVPELGREESKP